MMRKLVTTIVAIGFPIVIFLSSYARAPGYWEPMFKQPLGIGLLILATLWLIIGAVLLLITDGFRRKLVFIVFPFAVTVFVMLGPAILTILTALGPLAL